MKVRGLITIVILTYFFASSCEEVKKEVATDQILGKYEGKATFIYKHSMQNIGIEDEWKESLGTIRLFKHENGDSYITTSHGDVRLSGITLASNGTAFNIPDQLVKQKNGAMKELEGFSVATLEGRKYDGLFNTDDKTLQFGYQTLVSYDYFGLKAEVLLICQYEFNKIY